MPSNDELKDLREKGGKLYIVKRHEEIEKMKQKSKVTFKIEKKSNCECWY